MVRTRSDEKRGDIIRVAAESFQELGYERTSMLTIAERIGGQADALHYFPQRKTCFGRCSTSTWATWRTRRWTSSRQRKTCARAWRERGNLPRAPARPAGISNMRIVAPSRPRPA